MRVISPVFETIKACEVLYARFNCIIAAAFFVSAYKISCRLNYYVLSCMHECFYLLHYFIECSVCARYVFYNDLDIVIIHRYYNKQVLRLYFCS